MFMFLVTAFVVLSVRGIDTTTLSAFVVFVVMNTIPAVAALTKSHQLGKKMDSVASDITTVVESKLGGDPVVHPRHASD